MNTGKQIAVGIILILFGLTMIGCGTDPLKSSEHSPQDEAISEGESSPEHAENEISSESGESESPPEPTENPETNCSSLNPHPMAEGIAEQFEVSYDQIMTWYCDGAAFSDILLALETEGLVDLSVEEMLSMVEDNTWDEIWQELGIDPK